MPLLFPTQGTLHEIFPTHSSIYQQASKPKSSEQSPPTRRALFPAWSAVDDVKSKAGQLSAEAQKEFAKASEVAQAKAGNIELYSPKYYAACTLGGLLACGVTHTAVTPLDLVKCRRQVDSKMYTGNFQAWGKIGRAEGFRGIYTGWSPTFFGYSVSHPPQPAQIIGQSAHRITRPKEHSNTAATSSSRNSTQTSPAKSELTNTRPRSTLPPAPPPNSSPTSPSAPLKPSKSACKLPSRPSPPVHSPVSPLSLVRKALLGEFSVSFPRLIPQHKWIGLTNCTLVSTRVSTLSGAAKSHTR